MKKFLHHIFLCLVIGLSAGIVTTIFGKGLILIGDWRASFLPYLLVLLPLAGLLIVYLYQTCGGEAQKGMKLVLAAGQEETTHIPKRLVPLIITTTWLTHLFGASAGREGVAVQIGATLGQHLGRGKAELSQSDWTIVGMAAGFAGLFQTPLAAAFFAIEVIRKRNWNLLPYTLLAAYTASHLLGLERFTHILSDTKMPSILEFFKIALACLLFAFVGKSFSYLLAWTKKRIQTRISNPYFRIFWIGLILAIIMWLTNGRYSGLGTNLIEASLSDGHIATADFFIKAILTIITLAAGFQGGEVTPLFSIGASLGAILAIWLGLPVELTAALGYITVFGSATATFWAPIFIGLEVFGAAHWPYYALALLLGSILLKNEHIYK